jgi:hypothetical protein
MPQCCLHCWTNMAALDKRGQKGFGKELRVLRDALTLYKYLAIYLLLKVE